MSALPGAHRNTAVLDGDLERATFANPETGLRDRVSFEFVLTWPYSHIAIWL
jgi:hypothetical protein